MYMRALAVLGLTTLMAATLLVGQIAVARNRTYLVDVAFTVDETVGGTADRRAPIELRVLGDSTAAGVGSDDPRSALPSQLAWRVARWTGRAVHVVGHGVSGARTADVRRNQIPHVGAVDVIVIVVGSNDVIHVTTPQRLRADTVALLEDAVATGSPVVVGGIPRFAGVGALAQPLRAVVDGYAAVLRDAQRDVVAATPGATFVDIAALASPRFRGIPGSMSSDAFHPSAIGYGFWADALAPAVAAVVQR